MYKGVVYRTFIVYAEMAVNTVFEEPFIHVIGIPFELKLDWNGPGGIANTHVLNPYGLEFH